MRSIYFCVYASEGVKLREKYTIPTIYNGGIMLSTEKCTL